jgi:uncharacterized lipoprotein YajG
MKSGCLLPQLFILFAAICALASCSEQPVKQNAAPQTDNFGKAVNQFFDLPNHD